MPKVSVIIPTCNRAEFLRSAIRSVLDQTFQDFEIVVVDDASKENTKEVVTSFNDKRIKYIRHETNKGGSASRNTGIKISSGEYIAFLDDDDEWLSEKLKIQVDVLENSSPNVGGVYTGHLTIDKNNRCLPDIWIPKKRGNIFKDILTANWVGPTSSLILRRECFDKVGLFDETLPSFQDYDMWIRISREYNFEYVEKPLFSYRVHENKVWTNLEALGKGMEIMLKKYGQFPAVRKEYSHYYRFLGILYYRNGNAKKGREAFLKAIWLYPFQIRHYFNLGLSLLGVGNYRRLKSIKEKLAAPLRHGKISIDQERL